MDGEPVASVTIVVDDLERQERRWPGLLWKVPELPEGSQAEAWCTGAPLRTLGDWRDPRTAVRGVLWGAGGGTLDSSSAKEMDLRYELSTQNAESPRP